MNIQLPSCSLFSLILLLFGLKILAAPSLTFAQSPPITSSGLNTQVSTPQILPTGQTQYNITGGTRPGGGTNLFHSFGNFNVPTNNIANFLNDSGLPTSNILGRVTLGNPSVIFGTIQTNGPGGFGNANLFLMNPAGFLFGPNATLNVGGMVAFTTADYLRFQGTQTLFNNASTPDSLNPLSVAPVAAFGFLGNNPAAIAIQGSTLQVAQGQSLTLVGGSQGFTATDPDTGNPIIVPGGVTMTGGSLLAPSGHINLASVASPGEILVVSLQPVPNINGQSFTSMGPITLTQGATLDVSDNAFAGDGHGGTIRIRGGQFIQDGSFMFANTMGDTDGEPNALVIDAQGGIALSNSSMITSLAFAGGRSGDIVATTPNLTMTDGSLIATASFGSGAAGNISLNVGSLNLMTNASVQSLAFADGRGGDIGINANTVSVSGGGFISTGTFSSGPAGNINMNVGTLSLDAGQISTAASDIGPAGNITITATGDVSLLSDNGPSQISNFSTGAGAAGNISLQVGSLSVASGSTIDINTQSGDSTGSLQINSSGPITLSGVIGNIGFGPSLTTAGPVQITAPSMTVNNGAIETQISGEGRASDIILQIGTLNVNGNSRIDSTTIGPGRGGDIKVTSDSVSISGNGSGLFSDAQPGTTGRGGDIHVQAHQISLSDGATISSKTEGSGNAGNILVKADLFNMNGGATITASSADSGNAGTVTIEGTASPAQSVLIDGAGSGIFTDTSGTGAGGNIFVNANSVTLSNGGTLSATTSGSAPAATGGAITIAATDVQLNDGAVITAQTTGPGNAGPIFITANDSVFLLSGSSILSTSFFNFSGNGGPVTITAPTVSLQNSSIVTLAQGFGSDVSTAAAGNVTINASKSVSLSNATIDSSIGDTAGNAGHISITSPTVTLSNASTISSAASNSGFNPDGSPVGLATDGHGGLVEFGVGQLVLADFSQITTQTTGGGQGGSVSVHGLAGQGSPATDVTITSGAGIFTNATDLGAAGSITVNTAQLAVTGGGQLQAATIGPGSGGTITIQAAEQVTVSGELLLCPACPVGHRTLPSQLNTSSAADGRAGDILVQTPSLTLMDGGQIVASTIGAGPGGTVTVQGLQGAGSLATSLLVSGQSSEGAASGIFTTTSGTGAGGNITINANTVTLQNGATLSAATSGTVPEASGGTITINAPNTVTMTSGAIISANSTGGGKANAGDINITAMNGFSMQDSQVTTQVTPSAGGSSAGGGNIKITTSPAATVYLQNSTISASVADGPGGGGNISIDPQFVILQNSQILAQAAQGQGGAITITAGLFLPDAISRVNADSGSGLNGTVTIQSPNSPASGRIIPLSQKPLIATALLTQRCAALTQGNFSSFTVAGRDSLPAEPGSWLSTPLAIATLSAGAGQEARGEGNDGREAGGEPPSPSPLPHWGRGGGEGETPILSLRQIAPPGFLTQTFAANSSAGCTS